MYITKSHLLKFKPKKNTWRLSRTEKIVNNLVNIFSDDGSDIIEFETSIFLSHKHGETEILEQVVALFKTLRIRVYLDWQDSQLPTETSRETAEKIKNKIFDCDKFIFLATQNAIESKWCNWELGYADSIKFPKNLAVMPIAKDDGEWIGTEYLNIYPIIKVHNELGYCVEYDNKIVDLITWIIK